MKLKLADLLETLYTPNGQVWTWDAKLENVGPYYADENEDTRWTLVDILSSYGEVSTEPYPRTFKVGDRITTEQEARTLPVSAVVLNRNDRPLYKDNHGWWYKAGTERPYLNSRLDFPATVIWLPEEAGE